MDLNIEKYIGICILSSIIYDYKIIPEHVSICYGVLSSYRNKGYASTILREMVDELLLNRSCSKLVLEIESTNPASLMVASKAGFKIDFEYSKIFESEGYEFIALSLSKKDYEKGKIKLLQ